MSRRETSTLFHIDAGPARVMNDCRRRITFASLWGFGVKVRAPCRRHRQRGQRVLETPFKGEKLEHAQIDCGVESAGLALVGADGAVSFVCDNRGWDRT